MRRIILMASSVWFLMASLSADEPIMNMMPRWDDGWGYQFIEEYRHESDLLLGSRALHPGYTEDVYLLHSNPSTLGTNLSALRPSCLMCSTPGRRCLMAPEERIEHDNGIGDATLALPLKKYFNLDGKSGSWTFKPMLRVPFSGTDDYEIYDNEWGNGLGWDMNTRPLNFTCTLAPVVGCITETNPSNPGPRSISATTSMRGAPTRHSCGRRIFTTRMMVQETLLAGPALYWNINDIAHFRIEWKHDFHDRQGVLDHGNGDVFKFSLGFVFSR